MTAQRRTLPEGVRWRPGSLFEIINGIFESGGLRTQRRPSDVDPQVR